MKKIIDWLKKNHTCRVISDNTLTFTLTKKQQEQVDALREEYGGMDFCFYPLESDYGFKVKVWKTNEWIDLTEKC